MRTLFLAPELFTDNGGIPRILRLYLKALCELAEKGDTVRFITLNDHSVDSRDLKRYANDYLVSWHACGQSKYLFVKAVLRCAKKCDRIICGHVAQLPVAFAAKLINPKLKYSVVAHGIEVWRTFTLAERVALAFSDKVFCISQFTRDHMREFCRMRVDKMPILYNGLDAYFPISTIVPPPPKAPVIVTVARLSKFDVYKGIDTLIEALPLIRKKIPDTTLCIIGQGDDATRLRDIADRLDLGNAVEMPGFLSDEALQQRLKDCALFALPSKKEGFGLVFLEAMAQGRPCLGARAGGIPEVLNSEVGVIVDYGSVPMIAEACIKALERSWDANAILERARFFAYPNFKDRLGQLLQST